MGKKNNAKPREIKKKEPKIDLHNSFAIYSIDLKLFDSSLELLFDFENVFDEHFDEIFCVFNLFNITKVSPKLSAVYPLLIKLNNKDSPSDIHTYTLTDIVDLLEYIPIIIIHDSRVSSSMCCVDINNKVYDVNKFVRTHVLPSTETIMDNINTFITETRSKDQATLAKQKLDDELEHLRLRKELGYEPIITSDTETDSNEVDKLINILDMYDLQHTTFDKYVVVYGLQPDANIYTQQHVDMNVDNNEFIYTELDQFGKFVCELDIVDRYVIITDRNLPSTSEGLELIAKSKNVIIMKLDRFKHDKRYLDDEDNKTIILGSYCKFNNKSSNSVYDFCVLKMCNKCFKSSIVRYTMNNHLCIHCKAKI